MIAAAAISWRPLAGKCRARLAIALLILATVPEHRGPPTNNVVWSISIPFTEVARIIYRTKPEDIAFDTTNEF